VSNFLSVAAVTASLSHVLQASVGVDVPGATVTTARPDAAGGGQQSGIVNLYLFQVSPNPTFRNMDLPSRRENGSLVQRPCAALDLHYLLSFYGDESQFLPQRLLGSVVRTLHAQPVLSKATIRAAISDPTFSGVVGRADLALQVERVRITPLDLSLDELSKLWSVFFQTPYALSTTYQADVVLIEADTPPTPPHLPVRQASVYVAPFRQPAIERVESADGATRPIVAASQIAIVGQRLRADVTRVRLGGTMVEPQASAVSDKRIVLAVPATARAGVQALQVVHPMNIGDPPIPHPGMESNVAAFVLRPTISATVANVTGSGTQPRSADVTVTFAPDVGQLQRVVLFMTRLQVPPGQPPGAFTFEAPPRDAPSDPERAASITFPVRGLPAGAYLVRVQVDGAESLPTTNASGVFTDPQVTL
jgi:hypothetical protein